MKKIARVDGFWDEAEEWLLHQRRRIERTGETAEDTVAVIQRLYDEVGLEKPEVVFCQSPVQMRLMPLLFIAQSLPDSDKRLWQLIGEPLMNMIVRRLTEYWGDQIIDNLVRRFELVYHDGALPGEYMVNRFNALQAGVNDPAFWEPSKYFEEGAYGAWTGMRASAENSRQFELYDQINRYIGELHQKNILAPVDRGTRQDFVNLLCKHFNTSFPNIWKPLDVSGLRRQCVEVFLVHFVNKRVDAGIKLMEETEFILSAFEQVHLLNPFSNFCFVSSFPSRVEKHKTSLHSENGPALRYGDGLELFFWRGVRIPGRLLKERDSITIETIKSEKNVEIRRVMLELFGLQRFLQESNAQAVHEDEYGTLYKCREARVNDMVMVRVKNSTVEPDGSHKEYWLRVPPHIKTAREAVAWTFDMSEHDYGPDVES